MTNDPANYRALSEPFSSIDDAGAALEAFYADVSASRQRNRITDVLVVTSVNVMCEPDAATLFNEQEQPGVSYVSCGDSAKAEHLAAWVFGQTRAARKTELALLLTYEPPPLLVPAEEVETQ